jgi:2-amino-4-hydroxy-6-hydroxymethyldihydropteridine diphosphokinase
MDNVYLLIGGNLGDRVENLDKARQLIAQKAGELRQISLIYETAAWGIRDQASFLNQALEIDTKLGPHELLQVILDIEIGMGRVRDQKNGPRLIDIDILFYNDQVIDDPVLSLPHPLMQERRFVLAPLNEICPDFCHPLFLKTVTELLAECSDLLEVKVYYPE